MNMMLPAKYFTAKGLVSLLGTQQRLQSLSGSSVRREKARSLSGSLTPTRQLSLQPVAIGAVVEVTKRPKPSK
jgi:hypothetical protein